MKLLAQTKNGNGRHVERPNCSESGVALRKESGIAELAVIEKAYAKFSETADAVAKDTVLMANVAREIGIHLQTLSGHEQVSFEFWQKHCEGKLPFKFDAAKMFVSVARGMEKPARSLTEAAKWIQQILAAEGHLELPSREENQVAVSVSIMQKFFKELTCLSQPWKKLESENPIEGWTKKQVDTGLAETEWLSVARDRMIKRQNQLLREL